MDISTPHPGLPSVATPSVLPSDAPTDGLSAWADIDLDAIRGNVARLGELAGDAAVMAVVKGDAYGHGLVPVAEAALAGGATHLAIAQLGEAMAARVAGVTAPILTWLFPPGAHLAAAVRADLAPGAAPRTSTPPTAPSGAMTTLQPVGRRGSVNWPTRRPRTSVSVPG